MANHKFYGRTFFIGAILFTCVALKMVSRHDGHWSTYPPQNFLVLVVAWITTSLLTGVVAANFPAMRSWPALIGGSIACSFVVMFVMLFVSTKLYGPSSPPKFKDTNEMMAYFAGEAVKWVKHDRGIDLDYSLDSIKIIEEELARISKEINKENPQKGTFGTASAYGAYVGEVFRRADGGSWAVDHSEGGPRSYPLTTKRVGVIFPVGWCWKRLTVGEEENVYVKAMYYAQQLPSSTNSIPGK